MDLGAAIFSTHDAIAPGTVARLVEERGMESLFFPEHTHIPASRQSPYPGPGELPRRYMHTYDLFVAMTAAASRRPRTPAPDRRRGPVEHALDAFEAAVAEAHGE